MGLDLHLHPDQLITLCRHLAKVGVRESGGVLVGEHVSQNVFRVVDMSFQRSTGTRACFVRHPKEHERFMTRFFAETGNDYARFNYLGEWHSHPSFNALPSKIDHQQMQAVVEDGSDAPLFAVLIVVRLVGRSALEMSAHFYRRGYVVEPVAVQVTSRPIGDLVQPKSAFWWRLFRRQPEIVQLDGAQEARGLSMPNARRQR